MSTAYKFSNPDGIYFTSFACVQWVDVFVRKKYSEVLIESLSFCQKQKGLIIHAWCIMPSHVHLIISRSKLMSFIHKIRSDIVNQKNI